MASEGTVGIHTVLAEEARHLQTGLEPEPDSPRMDASPPRIGLALSGGGIRSATFSLGVLQALAAEHKLASFDYLSTVSGGGYIGSWLSAWIHRRGLKEVQDELKRHGSSHQGILPAADEPEQVTWLRRYSNYLTPRVGIFSLDSLTLICTWLRNVALNLIVILGSMALLFLLPYVAIGGFQSLLQDAVTFGFAAGWSALVALALVGYNLWHQGMPINRRRNWVITTPGVILTAIVPSVLAASFASVWLFQLEDDRVSDALQAARYVIGLLLFLLLAWFAIESAMRKTLTLELLKNAGVYALAGGAAVVVGALVLAGMLAIRDAAVGEPLPGAIDTRQVIVLVAYGPPALLVALCLATSVFTGLVGRVFYERSREWWSRLNAWLAMVAAIWALWGTLAFFSLPWLQWVHGHLENWVSALGTAWVGSLLAAIFVRKPEAASEKTQLRVDLAINAAATVFMIGLLIVVAAATSWGLVRGSAPDQPIPSASRDVSLELKSSGGRVDYRISAPEAKAPPAFSQQLCAHISRVHEALKPERFAFGLPLPLAALLALLVIVLVFGLRVDINKFSLHNMYKNRLIRCYLGASNKRRNEQPFTGLDDEDDIPLRDLCDPWGPGVQRPMHIINTALNISQGANLAWQERKAASFVLTPLYCGFSLARTQGDTTSTERDHSWETPGYRPTSEYASRDPEEQGFSLGMALATSGAAVSPNMGHATRPARAFVLTMFNLRLGRWSPNPMGHKWKSPSPRFGLVSLVQELFGYSNERRDFVYLSDGGHFDNLGLYELVRRRCEVIVAVDAGADPKRSFGDLAESIRKCRIDMGVEISLPIQDLMPSSDDPLKRPAKSFALGRIRYGNGLPDGQLLLIKPTMCKSGTEPVDLLNYAEQNPPFPQQSTADQFFGESQFESYRRLGLHIGSECLRHLPDLLPTRPVPLRRPPAPPPHEAPTFPTRWLGKILGWWRKEAVAPRPRDGSLVDALVFTTLAALAMALLLWLFGAALLGNPGACWSLDACRVSVAALLDARPPPLFGVDPRWVFLALDNLFVVLYTASFLMLFVVATRHPDKSGRDALRSWVLLVLCLLASATFVVDYYENFSLLSRLVGGQAEPVLPVARMALTKFVLATICLVAAVPAWLVAAKRLSSRWRD